MSHIYLAFVISIIFIACAVLQFVEGNHTNGVLWLILAQLYDIAFRIRNKRT